MKTSPYRSSMPILAIAACAVSTGLLLAQPPAPPAVSKFAPAKDLEGQVESYVEALEKTVAAEEYTESEQNKVASSASTLAALALAVANHDQASSLKEAAPGVIKAAQQLAAAAEDQDKAKAEFAAVKKAMAGSGGAAVEWGKVAELEPLMKQVQILNTRLKSRVKGSKLKKYADRTTGYSVTLAAIAQATLADTSAAKKPEERKKWYEFAAQMRDAAGEVNAAIHKQDAAAVKAAMGKLKKSCDDCHAVFEQDQL